MQLWILGQSSNSSELFKTISAQCPCHPHHAKTNDMKFRAFTGVYLGPTGNRQGTAEQSNIAMMTDSLVLQIYELLLLVK